jgi:nesprin-1
MKHYATNLMEEFALKEYDRKWIMSVSNELLVYFSSERHYDSPEKIDIECKISNLNTKWNNVKQMYDNKTRKINEIKTTYFNLEARISEIRKWLFETEKELLKPFVFEEIDKKSYDVLLGDYDKLKRSVENRSSSIGEILNLSELMISELRHFEMDFNIKNLEMSVNNIEYRWKKLCETLVQRKQSLISIWKTLEEIDNITKENVDWIVECDNVCNSYETPSNKLSRKQSEKDIEYFDDQLNKISIHSPVFEILEKQYKSLMTTNIDIDNLKRITADTRKILIIWKTIIVKITTIRTMLQQYLTDYSQFTNLHENIIISLTQIDVEITNIKHLNLYENEDEEIMKINKIKVDLDAVKNTIDSAETLKTILMEKSDENDKLKLQEMSDEYMKLYDSIKLNYDDISSKYANVIGLEPVQERDFAVQVNTLQTQSSVSPKDAYLFEILSAINEFRTNIENLEKCVQEAEEQESGVISKSTSSKINKNIAACESSLELIRYLNSLLIKEYNCTDQEAHTDEINNLYARFQLCLELWNSKKVQSVQTFAEHHESDWHSCPFCSQRNWQQIDNDLWRLEQWLHLAETQRKVQTSPPSNIEELEDVIQDHREFLLNLDSQNIFF